MSSSDNTVIGTTSEDDLYAGFGLNPEGGILQDDCANAQEGSSTVPTVFQKGNPAQANKEKEKSKSQDTAARVPLSGALPETYPPISNETRKIREVKAKKHTLTEQLNNNPSMTKGVKVIKNPRTPTERLLEFKTSRYILYNPEEPNLGTRVDSLSDTKRSKFFKYEGYVLFRNRTLTDVSMIPKSGVRLDDLNVARVLTATPNFTKRQLNEFWPAEFDRKGMIRAERVPLGDAAKMYVHEGEIDVDGKIVEEGAQGFYYKWWGGLHQLCGEEGLANNMYLIRPSREDFKCWDFGFKVGYRAMIQHPDNAVEEGSKSGAGREGTDGQRPNEGRTHEFNDATDEGCEKTVKRTGEEKQHSKTKDIKFVIERRTLKKRRVGD